jgi:glycerophosphoryl diester phosphodiesterase
VKFQIILCLIFVNSAFAKTLMVSHKGIWKDHSVPQNSLSSLKKAITNGFEGIEFDILKTKDNEFVLAHDDNISKLSTCKNQISNMTLLETSKCIITKNTSLPITQLLLKRVKNPEPIVSLNDIVKATFFDDRLKFIWIDMKNTSFEVLPILKRLSLGITDKKVLNKIVINNTSIALLKKLKVELPEFKYSLEGKWGSEPLTDYKKYFDGIGITHDYISLNVGIYLGHEPLYKLINRRKRFWRYLNQLLDTARNKSIPILGWTVNSRKKIKRLKLMEIDFLLTDRISL